jgi:serine/threonine protein kinase
VPLEPGQTLLHYRIVEKLGEGGMGAVYRAEDTRLGREIAIKVMPAELAADTQRRRRFEQEARAVAALKHPNIVTVHSVEEAEGVSFITMELIEGRPLSELIPKGGFDLARLFELAIPAAEALGSAHAKRITHRDLKPSNMMLDADGRLKVLDFGLAKLLAPDDASDMNGAEAETATQPATSAPRTEEGKILGTAAYMSPEQAEGKPVDARTDIFSLGVVLYEMATGRRPFQGDTTISTISSILKDTPPRVSDLRPGLPRDLGRIIDRCLEKNTAKRFQTARDIANELEGLKKEIDSGELQEVSSPRAAPPSPTPLNKTFLVAGLVVGAVLIAAAAVVLWPRLVPTPSSGTATAMDDKSIAVLPFANMSDDDKNEHFSDGLAEELLNRLSRVPDLRVAARTSSYHFKGHTGDVSEVAQQLNVTTILEGSVRRAGDRVRVTARLINASDGFPLWSESYDGQLDDVFGIQERIATQVVEALKITLLGDDARRLASRPTDSVEAYEAYLLGHQRMRNRRSDELEQAVQ